MSIQDRAYAAGIFLIIGICCIGAYVAVSGFQNANPGALGFQVGTNTRTRTPDLAGTIVPGSTVQSTLELVATVSPLETGSPIAIDASPTSLSRGTPSPDFIGDIPTATPMGNVTSEPPPTSVSGCGSTFCPRPGPPSDQAPTGNICPANYLWGFVYDRSGQGMPGVGIKWIDPGGNKGGPTATKGSPDPAGRYDIPAGSGGTWILQVVFQGVTASPAVPIKSRVSYGGGPLCPTRLDFVQQ